MQTLSWITITDLDGRVVARITPPSMERWDYIQGVIAELAACHPDEVDCTETDDGDVVIVLGEPAYRLLSGYVHAVPATSRVEEAA